MIITLKVYLYRKVTADGVEMHVTKEDHMDILDHYVKLGVREVEFEIDDNAVEAADEGFVDCLKDKYNKLQAQQKPLLDQINVLSGVNDE